MTPHIDSQVPGLMGLVRQRPDPGIGQRFTATMASSAKILDTATDDSGHWIVGHATASARSGGVQTARSGIRFAVHGVVDREPRRQRATEPCPHGADIERLYAKAGLHVGQSIDGAFCAVIVDVARSKLLLINDLTGTFPMYWQDDNGTFAFAPTVSAVVNAIGRRSALDVRAAADYLHYGFLFGSKTLARGVQIVPAGTTLVYDWRSGSVEFVESRQAAALFERVEQSRTTYLDNVTAAFNAAVTRACDGEELVGLSLSGGLDSRAILSAMGARATPPRTYTVGVQFCADHVISERLSRISGTAHTFLELGDEYLNNFLPNLERMVMLTDGMYLSHGLTEVLALEAVRQTGVKTLLRGHCGELAKTRLAWPFHTDDRVLSMRSKDEFVPYFFNRVNYVSRSVKVEELFQGDHVASVRGAARQSLDDAIHGLNLAPADLCSYLYLTQHHRRFTIPSIQLFRHQVEVGLPFADAQFLRVLLSGMAEWREGTDIHRHITGANNPRLSRVRNSNTGAPGSAGPTLEKLMDPINSILKRLNARGYKHYHRFDLWMREQLLASVEEILFDGMTARRGVFQTSTVRRLADETRQGIGDHAYLLQVLLIIELWQRQHESVAV